MPAFQRTRSLDPRLERLILRSTDFAWAADARSGLVEQPNDMTLSATTRVLVLLATSSIPRLLNSPTLIRITERTVTVDVPIDQLKAIAQDPGVLFVEAGRRLLPSLTSSVSAAKAAALKRPPTSLDGAGVVIGIIDFGFDYTLDDFRDEAGRTRVAYLWDQELIPEGNERSPDGFPYGVEYIGADIDAALAVAYPFTQVRHKPEAESHGTHVAGIAAGNGRSHDTTFPAGHHVGIAPAATLIFVQPKTGGPGRSFTDSVRVADAIAYVFARARQLGLPCVINLSLGQNGGSHDGESVVERSIDQLAGEPGRAFVVAAGNEHTWRGHASGTLAEGESRTLRVGVGLPPMPGTRPGEDRTPNEIEVWHSSRDSFSITVRSPDGDVVGPVAQGQSTFANTASGNRVVISSIRFTELNGESQIFIELSPGTERLVRRGIWEITLDADRARVGRFDAFIERDARDPDNGFADQATFSDDDFDGVMTLGTPATTRRGIAIANYDHATQAPASSSSRGPTRDGRPKPEIAAPGTSIASSCALGGRVVAGEVIPMRVTMSGTSMAAPHVAGIAALLLQRHPKLTAKQIAAVLVATADAPPGITPFDAAWGYGRVDAAAAVAAIP